MHFFLDFDHTVFDTTVLWERWLDVLHAQGISPEDAKKAAESLIHQAGFTHEMHARAVGCSSEQAYQLAQEADLFARETAPTLVYKDVIPFLETKTTPASLSLLTYGDAEFQQKKVQYSGLLPYFSEIRIASPAQLKVDHLRQFLVENPHTPVVFVDDSPHQLEPVANAELPVKLFRITRLGSRHGNDAHALDGKAWTVISSLDDMHAFL